MDNEEDLSIGNWMMDYAEKVLRESGYKTIVEWEQHHKEDFYTYIATTA